MIIFGFRMITEVVKIAEEISKKSPVAVQGTKVSLIYARDHSVNEGLDQIVSTQYYLFLISFNYIFLIILIK